MKALIHPLHVWSGAGAGLFLLLLCLSGSLAVFRLEISHWVAGGHSSPANCTLAADSALATLRSRLQEAPDTGGLLRRLSLPELTGGYWELRLANGERAQADLCGDALQGPRSQTADFLVNLHTRLFMGKAGRWIVGLFGVLMLLSLISGVFLHRKVLRQLFTLRSGKSPRLVRSDGHKLLGIWLLPFLLLTAFSGAWLGLATLVATPEIKGVKAAATPAYTTPAGLQQMLDDARQQLPGLVPVFIDFFPEKGHVSVRGNLPGHLVQRYSAEVLYAGHSGLRLGAHDPRQMKGLPWWHQAMMPLHLGDWSGMSLRWLYAVLGLGCCVLIWLGLWLWADRRLKVAGNLLPRGRLAGWVFHAGFTLALLIAIGTILLWRIQYNAAGKDLSPGLIASAAVALAGLLLVYLWRRGRGDGSGSRPDMQ
jgi:uncharacterized iron-regulated membrane protein